MAKPTDRYGNPIDKENLDLYDDEDIYETDEKGFVLLPKRLKSGLNKVYKTPLEQANAIAPQQTKVKGWNEEIYNDIIDNISKYRGCGLELGKIQDGLIKQYGPKNEELVRYAFSKWAE